MRLSISTGSSLTRCHTMPTATWGWFRRSSPRDSSTLPSKRRAAASRRSGGTALCKKQSFFTRRPLTLLIYGDSRSKGRNNPDFRTDSCGPMKCGIYSATFPNSLPGRNMLLSAFVRHRLAVSARKPINRPTLFSLTFKSPLDKLSHSCSWYLFSRHHVPAVSGVIILFQPNCKIIKKILRKSAKLLVIYYSPPPGAQSCLLCGP